MKILKTVCLILELLTFCACSNDDNIQEDPQRSPFDEIQLIGHMGDCVHAPENTMPSFVYAADSLGLHWIECDPNVTKDGVIVLNHMQTIDSHSNGTGNVSEMTYEELLQYDFGNPAKFGTKYKGTAICTAEEVLRFAKSRNIIIEFDFSHFDYTRENVQKLYDMVVAENYTHNTIFEPSNEAQLNAIAEVTTSIPVIYVGCDAELIAPPILDKFQFVVIGLNHRKVGDRTDLADKIHIMGYKAASGVINPVPENPIQKMNELIDMGFDYIYSESIPYSAIIKN